VKTVKCSLLEMDFPDESFDIIWAEGSIRLIGFEQSLKKCKQLLKPKGYLVIHDVINSISGELKKLNSWGYKLIDQISLPEDAWWTEFYEPLEIRVKELYVKYKKNDEMLKMLKKYQTEVAMVKSNPKDYCTAFYIIQKS